MFFPGLIAVVGFVGLFTTAPHILARYRLHGRGEQLRQAAEQNGLSYSETVGTQVPAIHIALPFHPHLQLRDGANCLSWDARGRKSAEFSITNGRTRQWLTVLLCRQDGATCQLMATGDPLGQGTMESRYKFEGIDAREFLLAYPGLTEFLQSNYRTEAAGARWNVQVQDGWAVLWGVFAQPTPFTDLKQWVTQI
jgi:hypothetical protein